MSQARRTIWFCASLTLALSVVFLPLGMQWLELRSTFESYSACLVAQDYVRAFDKTSAGFRSVTPLASFVAQQHALVESAGPIASVTRLNTNVYVEAWPFEWRGTVCARLSYRTGDLLIRYALVYEDNGWKISAYDSDVHS